MAKLIKYRIKCTTDNKYEYIWLEEGEAVPTTCPTNTAHTIDSAETVVVETQDDDSIKIKHEAISTGGNIKFKGFKVVAPATADVWTDLDVIFPYPVNLLRGRYFDNKGVFVEGDKARFCVAPNTTVGAITSDVTASDTVIDVQQSVIDNVEIGYIVKLDDGTNTDTGIVTAVNDGTNQITIDTGTANGYASATPTYVKMTVEMADDIHLGKSNDRVPMEGGAGTSYVTAGTIIRASFYNTEATAKDFYFELEYYY